MSKIKAKAALEALAGGEMTYDAMRAIITMKPTLLDERGKVMSAAKRKKACALISRVEAGTASKAELAWFAAAKQAIEAARK